MYQEGSNRRFLRKCKLKLASTPILSATPGPITPSGNAPLLHPYLPTSSSNDAHTAIEPHKQTTYTSPLPQLLRIPRALSRLLPHNRPGLKEGYSPHTTRPTCWAGGDVEVTALMCRINKNNNTYQLSGPS